VLPVPGLLFVSPP
jgi:hypothetical protein